MVGEKSPIDISREKRSEKKLPPWAEVGFGYFFILLLIYEFKQWMYIPSENELLMFTAIWVSFIFLGVGISLLQVNGIFRRLGRILTQLSIVVALVILIFVFILYPYYEEFRVKAREKEVYTLMNALYAATKAIGEEGLVVSNKESFGFNPVGLVHYHLYMLPDELPPDLKNRLPADLMPFVTKHQMRIIAVGEPLKGRIEFWVMDESKNIKKHPFSLPSKDIDTSKIFQSY